MYFEFEDFRPDTPRLDNSFSRRESVVYSVAIHVALILAILYVPRLPWIQAAAERARKAAEQQQRLLEDRQQESPRFVFVQPRLDTKAPTPPARAELSDQDRQARTLQRPPNPTNPLPYARGNSTERVESAEQSARARGEGPGPEPAPPEQTTADARETAGDAPALRESADTGYARAQPATPAKPGGSLGEALKNLQKYVQRETFNNPQGGDGSFGPSIQFDTKGVEFGPWIRRFIAQVKRNWFFPYAAMTFKGHVVLTFNVHRDGSITDLTVVQPSSIEAFTQSAFNAMLASNPTQPLPPEYPTDTAFFTVTFYFNENPPSQ
jgi:TonB family protein